MASALLTKGIVSQAIKMVAGGINEQFILGGKNRVAACIVVVDPAVQYDPMVTAVTSRSPSTTNPGINIIKKELPVVAMATIGEQDPKKWPRPYDDFAHRKAWVSWRTGLPSHIVQRDRPYLFQTGDLKYGGSTVLDGIIVATSGLAWEHDLAVSMMVAGYCKAMTIGAMDKQMIAGDHLTVVGQDD